MIFENNSRFVCEVDLSPDDFTPVTKEDQNKLVTMGENTSYWKDAWRRLKENNDIYTKSSFQENYGWQMNNVQFFDEPIEAKGHLSLWEYNIEK